MPTAVIVFISLCGLLVVGKVVRMRVPVLQRLYLPSSVIGGLIGLAVLSVAGDRVPREVVDAMRKVPGFLINVVFATLAALKEIKTPEEVARLRGKTVEEILA